MAQPPLLTDVLPLMAAALKPSLLREKEPGLAASIDTLRVEALCSCGQPDCMTLFATLDPSPCRGDYRVVCPDAVLTIGVCDERIWSIEDVREMVNEARFDEFVRLRSIVAERRD